MPPVRAKRAPPIRAGQCGQSRSGSFTGQPPDINTCHELGLLLPADTQSAGASLPNANKTRPNAIARRGAGIEDSEKSAEHLERYLGSKAICTGEADKMIKQDYENFVIEKEIESHLPNAWENVIEKESGLLAELIVEKIKGLCGHHPLMNKYLIFSKP